VKSERDNNYFLKGLITLIVPVLVCTFISSLVVDEWEPLATFQTLSILQSEGVVTDGCITEKIAPLGHGRYLLIYTFSTDQSRYFGDFELNRVDFDGSSIGDCFPITYLPNDPTINHYTPSVQAFSRETYWIDYATGIGPLFGFFAVTALLYLATVYVIGRFRRFNKSEKKS
jgi:hypothetical protein